MLKDNWILLLITQKIDLSTANKTHQKHISV
jgi:hypothetical protein